MTWSKAEAMRIWERESIYFGSDEGILVEDAQRVIGVRWVYSAWSKLIHHSDYANKYTYEGEAFEYFTLKGFLSLISTENIFQIRDKKKMDNKKPALRVVAGGKTVGKV